VGSKTGVAILGATGTVGQKFVRLLEDHPQFEIRELVASERSAGRTYSEAVAWKQETQIPARIRSMVIKDLSAKLESQILFSGLDSSVAGSAETAYAAAGHVVISNSSNHRMDSDVPLTIPEVNPDHFELVRKQSGPGMLVTNSNCSTMFLAMALAPIHRALGIDQVEVTTLQAISGGGYPGVASMDILGNVVPYIRNEEEKLEEEVAKILGTLENDHIAPANITVSAQCNRVPVFDGHLETVSFSTQKKASVAEIRSLLESFSGMPQEKKLPSAPAHPIVYLDDPDRPQPARDIWIENGMATVVGRLRECPVLDHKMVILGHNTVRGAAGAAILNAEAFVELGFLPERR
jgi:aspartate-semialdehyde dehydrogenase